MGIGGDYYTFRRISDQWRHGGRRRTCRTILPSSAECRGPDQGLQRLRPAHLDAPVPDAAQLESAATFSLSRGAHFIKFGTEFLKVSTRINDLNATVGRMAFENRFTNRAVGDLLLGLPSQLALTSYTVMEQGQTMQFYFAQDDYRVSPKLTANWAAYEPHAAPRRNEFATSIRHRPIVFAKTQSLRARLIPRSNNFAPRIGFASAWQKMAGGGLAYLHQTVRRAARAARVTAIPA